MKILQVIFTIYSLAIFVVLMLVFGLFILVPVLINDQAGNISFFFIRLWARSWALLSGFKFEIHGREHINLQQPYIYIFNHRSFFDAPIIPVAIPQQIRALGKVELTKIPIFGLVIRRLAVWVDRKDSASRKESLEKLTSILHNGISIVVSPEGTRNNSEETLLPFHSGAFRLSMETGIPILPIAVIGADKIHQRDTLILSPGKVKIYFSDAIIPSPEQSVQDFSNQCRSKLESMIQVHT